MKRFHFKLQKILELRKHREDEAKIELGRAIGILTEIENQIKQNAVKHQHAAAKRFADAGDAAAIISWDRYILRLEQEADRLLQKAAQAELVVEEKRSRYLEASRELKVMEKLKEKRGLEYRQEFFAAETAGLDDLWRKHSDSAD
ncbi:MAG: flagellar export protein FliJ [Treponema sp.]|jgi:flagellar FliJ protein|nr:flagellar export protein FliJ [Treponema sp.]